MNGAIADGVGVGWAKESGNHSYNKGQSTEAANGVLITFMILRCVDPPIRFLQ